ncbi:hypothetical protein [Arthrobacter sp. UYCo732]|uniref:hypothetical protein n=1 Tax=Arthrobacter sp. UYCo732 TaxID=3156336 RepID=UPI0033944C2C
MTAMSSPKKTFTVLAAAAVFLTAVTGCRESVTTADRDAYESARFGTPEAKVAADQELERLNARSSATSPAPDMIDVLLHPGEWPDVGKKTLCEYTTKLMDDARRNGNAVPERVRGAAEKVLERC